MKFAELKAVFNGWRIKIIALGEGNNATEEEISLLETVHAYDKLARYDEASIVRIDTIEMEQEGERYPALEVTVRV